MRTGHDTRVSAATVLSLCFAAALAGRPWIERFARANTQSMRLPLILGLLVTSVAVPALAEAAPRRYYRYEDRRYEDYESRDNTHRGLFVRGALGAGGFRADDDFNDETLSGGAGMFSIDLGGALAQDLALHGRFAINSVFEPTVSSDGEDLGDLDDTNLTFSLLGVGLTYYTPSNVYLTGVVGLSRASFELDGIEYDAMTGAGFMGDIGYEWLLGDNLGLGVGGRLELHSVRGDGETLSTASLGVLLSLTYF